MRPAAVRGEYWVDGQLVVVENIPAEVCSSCGEAVVTLVVHGQLDRLFAAPPAPRRTLSVPVYDFEDATPAADEARPTAEARAD